MVELFGVQFYNEEKKWFMLYYALKLMQCMDAAAATVAFSYKNVNRIN